MRYKDSKKYMAGAAFLMLGALPGMAQRKLPSEKAPTILPSQNKVAVSGNDTTFSINVLANTPYTITPSDSWLTATKAATSNNVFVKVTNNTGSATRTGTITFADTSTPVRAMRTLTIEQGRDNSAKYIAGDTKVPVTSGAASNYQSGQGIDKSYDGDLSTLYHSEWGGGNVTAENPAILTYNFAGNHIDYLTYVPRSGGGNGCFGELSIYYKQAGDANYTLLGDYDFKKSSSPTSVNLTTNGLDNVTSVQFVVKSGTNTENDNASYVSCAEMQFFEKAAATGDYDIFADDLLTTLKAGTTQADIDALTNPFCKVLAQKLFDGTYSTKFRVGEYPCLLSPEALSNVLNADGKYYDHYQGVTGVNIAKGTYAVVVTGLPENKSLSLKTVAWYSKVLDAEGKGAGPDEKTFPLKNGINKIEFTGDFDALAYVSYYDDVDPNVYSNVKVHIVNAEVNGYLTPKSTDDEIKSILAAAPNRCIDLVGEKVHSVWQVNGVKNYCKASDGVTAGQRQFMNLLDSLVGWEQEFIGLDKYNYNIKNKTMAYVNYTYYMFQGWAGVSFMYDQESRVLNCSNMMYSDPDGIWGLSHEWGHQHQMTPYFCWAGQAEVSNNMKSCYNEIHMGYHYGEGYWQNKFAEYKNDTHKGEVDRQRHYATVNASAWNYCDELKQQALHQDSTIAAIAVDPDHAVSYVPGNLGPYYQVYNYFANKQFSGADCKPDFSQDLYEALRRTDDVAGSPVEKSTGIDKYELLASVQNNNKNNKYATFSDMYPTSCWITKGYVSSSSSRWQNCVPYMLNFIRKTSYISGYNLYPYYEAWGFFRLINLCIDDYGNKYVAMTASMRDEFKADMQALVDDGILKEMPAGMLEKMSTTISLAGDRPVIPN